MVVSVKWTVDAHSQVLGESNLGLLGKTSNFLGKNFRILDLGNKSKSETNPRLRYLKNTWILCPVLFKAMTCLFF